MDPHPAAPSLTAVPRFAPTGGVLILNWRDTTHPEGGGSEVYIERIAAGLAAAGRPVTLFCAAHPGAPAAERVGGTRVVRRGGRRTVYLHACWAHLSGRLGPHEVVVDVQNGLPFFSALWCRRPLVVLVHHVHREQWRVVLPALQARLGWWVESRLAPSLYRRARYVAVSDATRRELVGLGVAAAAISVVHNGMALPDPAAAAPRTPHPSVCVLGRLVPHKRVELALEAAARIRRHLPGLRVVVVGQGWWEPRLREAVARLGLADAVELVGWVDEAAKQRLLASSWVLAMPSVKEGWGLAVLEAAANGTPTVAFRAAGGLGESVLHGTTGLLADDVDEFTRHLAWVLLNRHLRERLGEAARANAARYTWPQAVAAFAAVLDQATAPGRDDVIIDGMDGARIDRWLWAVRLVKTRSLAAQACRAGHVQINGARAKPAATVRVGDTVRARLGGRERVVEVARLLDTRVGAEAAASCLIDRSPPPPPRDPLAGFGARHPGAGRPTKQQRRQLDRARGRPPR